MEDFCKTLHPYFKEGSVCANWLHQAVNRCAGLIQIPSYQQFNVWEAIKTIMFSDTHVSIANFNEEINMDPNKLSFKECGALVINVFREYILLASRRTTESQMNIALWSGLITLFGATAMGCFSMLAKRIYIRYKNKFKQNTTDATLNKIGTVELLHITPDEFRRLKVHHIMRRIFKNGRCIKRLYLEKCENEETITSLGSLKKFSPRLHLLVVFTDNETDNKLR